MSKANISTTTNWPGTRGMFFVSLCVGLLLMGMSYESYAADKSSGKKPLGKSFPISEKCKRCHFRAFEEWEASAQSRSIVTAPFRVTLDRFLSKADEKDRGMCFRCHAPHILEYGELLPQFIKEVQSKDPHMDGVGCPQCHLIESVNSKSHPPMPSFKLGKTVFGGYDKAVLTVCPYGRPFYSPAWYTGC